MRIPPQPPQYRLPIFRQKFRFTGTNCNGITISDLAPKGWLSSCTSTASSTALTAIIQSYRIRKITVWILNSAASYAEGAIDWSTDNPNFSSQGIRVNSQQLGDTFPVYIETKPPPQSYQSSWISQPQSYLLFTIIGTAGTYVFDVDMDYTLVDNRNEGATVTLGTAVTFGSRIGQIGYTSMNWAQASGVWITPVGPSNTFT